MLYIHEDKPLDLKYTAIVTIGARGLPFGLFRSLSLAAA